MKLFLAFVLCFQVAVAEEKPPSFDFSGGTIHVELPRFPEFTIEDIVKDSQRASEVEDQDPDSRTVPQGVITPHPERANHYLYVTNSGSFYAILPQPNQKASDLPSVGATQRLRLGGGEVACQHVGDGTFRTVESREEVDARLFRRPPPPVRRPSDPLILDTNGDKIKMQGTPSLVKFDVDGDGKLEITGWVAGADDAFLVHDANKNGRIDNANELFGFVPGVAGRETNGFKVLSQFDSNKDKLFDSKDKNWKAVALWFDKNRNGRSETSELISLEKQGVLSIDLDYTEDNTHVDRYGNSVREYSSFQMLDKDGKEVRRPIANVWFHSEDF